MTIFGSRFYAATLTTALLAVLSICRPAMSQSLINFDDLNETALGSAIPALYDGLDWSNFYAVNSADYYLVYGQNGYTNGTISGSNVAYNADALASSISAISVSQPFTLDSGYFTAAWNNSLLVDVTGYNALGTEIDSSQFSINATTPVLEVFDWTGLNSVRFTSAGGTSAGFGGNGEHFALDNLTVNLPVAAPEAGISTGFGVGTGILVGVIMRGRCRRNRWLHNRDSDDIE